MGRFWLTVRVALAERADWLGLAFLLLLGSVLVVSVSFIAYLLPLTLGPKVTVILLWTLGILPAYARFCFAAWRRLLARPPRDRSTLVARGAAPALYSLVEDVARSLGTPAPANLRLSSDFDVVVVSSGARYELVLGLPLLDVLDRDELRAIVAYEMARAYGGDKSDARVFRAIARWVELIPRGTPSARDVLLVFDYAQLVAAVAILLLPRSEIALELRNERGRAEAGRLFGSAVLAGALLRPAIYAQHGDSSFWPGVIERHVLNTEPPDAVSQLRAICRAPMPRDVWDGLFVSVASARKVLDVGPADLYRVTWAPASDLIPADIDRYATAMFDTAWREGVREIWQEASRVAHLQEEELAGLDARGELDDAAAWRRIELISARRGASVVLPLMQDWLARHPDDAQATYQMAGLLAPSDPVAAIALLERSIQLDEKFEAPAASAIGSLLLGQGKEKETEAAEYFARAEVAAVRLDTAITQRVRKLDARRMRPHGLAAPEVALLHDRIAKHPAVQAAHVSSLNVDVFPTIPCIVVVLRFGWWWSEWHGEEKNAILAEISGVPLPMQIHAVALGRRTRPFTQQPAELLYAGIPVPRSVTFAKWGRRAQRALIAMGALLVIAVFVQYRDCFPGCWEDISAVLVLGPMLLGINALLLTGSPDTPASRGVAFSTSAFYAGMFFFGNLAFLVPVAFAGFLRAPQTRRALTWAMALSLPAFFVGWFVTRV